MNMTEAIEYTQRELNAMADRLRDLAQDLEGAADRLVRIGGSCPNKKQEFDEEVRMALLDILACAGKAEHHE